MKIVSDYSSSAFNLNTVEGLAFSVSTIASGTYFDSFVSEGEAVRVVLTEQERTQYYVFYGDFTSSNSASLYGWLGSVYNFLYLDYLGSYRGYDRVLFSDLVSDISVLLNSTWETLLSEDDRIEGGKNEDILYGYAGNDYLEGGGDSDILNGGGGVDTAIFTGNYSDYSIESITGGLSVSDLVGAGGTDTLFDIEELQFADTTVTIISGTVVDGYVAHADLYIDVNGNNIADKNEFTGVTTDSAGQFLLASPLEGAIMAVGGISTDTRLPNMLTLVAPQGSNIVSPITTLIDTIMDRQAMSATQAQAIVANAFGLDPTLDLLAFDPLADSDNSAQALEVQKINVQLAFTLSQSMAQGTLTNLASLIASGADIELYNATMLSLVLVDALLPEKTIANMNSAFDEQQSLGTLSTSQRSESITSSHEIAALYVAYFNRAPDKAGLDYWEDSFNDPFSPATLRDISQSFAQQPVFYDMYGSMDDEEFVDTIYVNMLGDVGDQAGIGYWINELHSGSSRSDVVANFVKSALHGDLSGMFEKGQLTVDEYLVALDRQNYITYRSMAGLAFARELGDTTNVEASGSDIVDDPAYLASIAVLNGVDSTISSYDSAIELIAQAEQFGGNLDYILGVG